MEGEKGDDDDSCSWSGAEQGTGRVEKCGGGGGGGGGGGKRWE